MDVLKIYVIAKNAISGVEQMRILLRLFLLNIVKVTFRKRIMRNLLVISARFSLFRPDMFSLTLAVSKSIKGSAADSKHLEDTKRRVQMMDIQNSCPITQPWKSTRVQTGDDAQDVPKSLKCH